MKIIKLIFLMLFSGFVQAQLPKLTVLTQEEINKLKPEDGTIVLNSSTQTLQYYISGVWYSLQGECSPRPVSPELDSCVAKNGILTVYFKSTGNFDFVVEDETGQLLAKSNKSPILIDRSKTKAKTLKIRAENICGKAGPISSKPIIER